MKTLRCLIFLLCFCLCAGAVLAQVDCNMDSTCIMQTLTAKKGGWRFDNSHAQNMNEDIYWTFYFRPNKTLTIDRQSKSHPAEKQQVISTTYFIRRYNGDNQLGVQIARFNGDINLLLYGLIAKEKQAATLFQFAFNPVKAKMVLSYHRSGPLSTINEFY